MIEDAKHCDLHSTLILLNTNLHAFFSYTEQHGTSLLVPIIPPPSLVRFVRLGIVEPTSLVRFEKVVCHGIKPFLPIIVAIF